MRPSLPVDPIPLLASVTLLRGKTRIFPAIADILSFQTLVAQAWISHTGEKSAELNADSSAIFACRAANMSIHMPIFGFKDAALTGKLPDQIEVRTQPKRPEPTGSQIVGIADISTRLTCAAFAVVTARMVEWVEDNVTTDRHTKFPPSINFGRVIRNAIVHGYTINIKSPNAPVVKWRGLEISNKDYGRGLFDTPLVSGGDLILLMMEMEMELNALNAPFDLDQPWPNRLPAERPRSRQGS